MKKNDFKAILWDNDGILVETEKWYFEATKQIMAKEGFNLSIDTYRDTFLKKIPSMLKILLLKVDLCIFFQCYDLHTTGKNRQ